ncbi:MAG: Hpt domain-containing protein, partial [Planctomycetaceae bacterium]|nr:Hpt domain-containing protein [Planctomycetaceae bacterium]
LSKPIDFQQLIQLVESTQHNPPGSSPTQWTSDPSMDVFVLEETPITREELTRTNGDVIDRESALQRLGGNEQLFGRMAQFFLSDSPHLVNQLRKGLQTRDAELVTRAAHSLKGLASNFDARMVVDAAQQLEDLGRAKKFNVIVQLLPAFLQEVQRLQSVVAPFACE